MLCVCEGERGREIVRERVNMTTIKKERESEKGIYIGKEKGRERVNMTSITEE